MNVADIKFRRVRVDEFTVQHWYDAGTKYLGAVYAVKCAYDYDIFDAEGNRFWLGQYESPRTLKDVKAWIANYDAKKDAEIAEEEAEREQKRIEAEKWKADMKAVDDEWMSEAEPMSVEVDQIIRVQMCNMSKPNSMGDAFVAYPGAESYYGAVSNGNGKIVHVTHITNEEFDAAVTDLYSNFKKEWLKLDGEQEHEFGGGYIGGHASDAESLQGLSFDEIFGVEGEATGKKQLFQNTAYAMVHAIVAPNRRVMLVNTEGYGYARYVGQCA